VPLLLLALPLLMVLALTILMPISLVQRYRVGTSRRRARRWVAVLNVAAMAFSILFFLGVTGVTSLWVPGAFAYSVAGLAGGCVLALIGLRLTRWEPTTVGLHFTPNRWLVLGLTLVVSARILYGLARGWQAWRLGLEDGTWVSAAGVAGSFAAGAIVLGYYLTYWIGVRRRIVRFERTYARRL
jgi:hypothetical protein